MADAEEIAAIRTLIAANDDDAALSRLRARLGWPAGKQLTELATWLGLLAELAERRSMAGLVDVAKQAVRDPDSPDRLYDLGYALIDSGAASIAASVLWHCLALVGDSEEVVCELVSALETALAYGDAYAILEQHAALRSRSFLCEYLFAFNAAMSGKLGVTRDALAHLKPDTAETESMRETLAAIVERADQVAGITPLDERDLRGWQYVLTGTLLSHRSPYGYEDGMNGRFAWLRDSAARVRTGVDRLAPLVRATDASCVFAGPAKDDETLAAVIAARLELPLVPWPAIGVPTPGVIAIYDLSKLPPQEQSRLMERRADQILYAHAIPWTQDARVAPDVTTLVCQFLAPLEDTVVQILASPGLDAEETAYDNLPRWEALVAATWPHAPGRRSRLWAGGPVPANRFG